MSRCDLPFVTNRIISELIVKYVHFRSSNVIIDQKKTSPDNMQALAIAYEAENKDVDDQDKRKNEKPYGIIFAFW